MSDFQQPQATQVGGMIPAQKKGRGCFFYGCLSVIVLLLVVVVGGYFGIKYFVGSLAEKYTSATPMTLPATNVSQSDYNSFMTRFESFKSSLSTPNATPQTLEMSARDINSVIEFDPNFEPLRKAIVIDLKDDQVAGTVSLPLAKLEIPFVGDRYLNGRAALKGAIVDGKLSIQIMSLEANGTSVSKEILDQINKIDFSENKGAQDPDFQRLLQKVERLEVKDSLIRLVPKR